MHGHLMRRHGVDVPSLVAGVAIGGLGGLLLLDFLEVIHLSLGWLWPAVLAVVGAILLALGLSGPRSRR
jgi:hypothetical protein